jgi:hypothetical protein
MPIIEVDETTLRGLLESEVPTLSHYSIGFVLPTATNGQLDANLGGSGTLVTIDSVHGILTARHVIEVLRKNKNTALVLPSSAKELHHVPLRIEFCSDLSFGNPGEESNGPDLAMLIPPPDVLETLRAKKSFYDMSKRQERMLKKPEPLEHGRWVLSGFAGEWTDNGLPEQGFSKVKIFKGMVGGGVVSKECRQENFDYLLFETLYEESYEGPERYGGFSGGGLWQLLVRLDGVQVRVVDRLLSGVAFDQSEKREDETGRATRDIKCRGRKSLYQGLLDKVRAQHP